MSVRWPMCTLGSEVTFLSGGTPKKSVTENWVGDIPWVSSGEMSQRFIRDTEHHVSEDAAQKGTRKVPANTVLVVVRGMSLAKEFRIALTQRDVTFNQDLKALVPKASIMPEFLFYYLFSQCEAIRGAATEASHGTKKLEMRVLEDWPFPVPTETEQEAVVDMIKAYDDLIENNRRRIRLLEESARLLYREWFVHLRFPGHEHVKIVNGVPEGWKYRPLRDVADVTMGQSPKSEFYNEDGEGLPFHQGVSDFGDRFVQHRVFCTVKNRLAQAGDILCSVRAPVGRLNITLDPIVIGRGLAAIRDKSGRQSHLFYQLRAHFFREDLFGSGAIFAAINKKELEGQEFLRPPERLIDDFEDFAGTIDQQIAVLHRQNVHLSEARDLLLPRLMNGEISV